MDCNTCLCNTFNSTILLHHSSLHSLLLLLLPHLHLCLLSTLMRSRLSVLMCLLRLLACRLLVALSRTDLLNLMLNRLVSVRTACRQLSLLRAWDKSPSSCRNSSMNPLTSHMVPLVCLSLRRGQPCVWSSDTATHYLMICLINCRDDNASQAWMLQLAFIKFCCSNQAGSRLPSGYPLATISSECCQLALPSRLPSSQRKGR